MKVLLDEGQSVANERVGGMQPWRVVVALAVVFIVVGGMDSLLTFFPTSFGVTEWEFGTITASLNGLPLPLLGLTLLLASSVALERAVLARAIALLLVMLAVAILVLGVIYATTIPQALRAAEQASGVGPIGIKKAIAKTAVQLVAYPAGLLLAARTAWTITRRRS